MKKVLILANFDLGLYRFRLDLIKELLKNYHVIISLPYGENVEKLKDIGCEFIDIPIDRRGINPIKDFALYRKYKEILKEIRPDLVITYTIKPNIYGGIACSIKKIPYAINITGLGTAFEKEGPIKWICETLYKIACKKAKVVFFENSTNRDFFVKEKIVSDNKTCLLNGAGVNLDEFALLDYPKNKINKFLFMGRIMAEKGVNELFWSMHKLHTDGEKFELTMLGMYEENYKDVIKKYEDEGWLKYAGFQNDVKPFIKESNCFVLPSWHEGMANTNLESAACGRPVITTNIPGCKEAVIDGISGFLVKKKDKEDLYITLKKFLNLSDEEKKKMGLEGRRHMEEIFDKKIVVKKTIDHLEA